MGDARQADGNPKIHRTTEDRSAAALTEHQNDHLAPGLSL